MAGQVEKVSRRELQETIDRQTEQLSRYETRLRDLVRAYKGLTKEKEALEKSLSAISTQKKDANAKKNVSDSRDENGAESDAESIASSAEAGEHIDNNSLRSQVQTLTTSLSTVSSEKSRLEVHFQEFKKKSVLEKREHLKTIETLQQDLINAKALGKKETEEMKSKWIIERHNRDKESNDHALMLRELQKVVADERISKEKLEQELVQTKDNLKALELAGTYNSEYERRVRELETEVSEKSSIIEKLCAKAEETPPELIKLRQDIVEMKAKHSVALQIAEQRARELEERSSNIRESQEHRVINLEERLQELSETVGSYDRLRQQDQISIQKLRDRVQQLDMEKNSYIERLSNSCHLPSSESSKFGFGDDDSNLDVQTLIERILKLRSMARDANKRSEHPIDLEELLEIDGDSTTRWKKSYYQLKDEFESYKNRKDVFSSNEMTNRRAISKTAQLDEEEIQDLKKQNIELRNRLSSIQIQLDQSRLMIDEKETKEKELLERMASQRQKFKEKQEKQDQELTLKIVELEDELNKQRERCLTLIEEKEDEISTLKSGVAVALEAALNAAAEGNSKTSSPSNLQKEAKLKFAAALSYGGSSSRPRFLSSTSTTGDTFVEEVTENLTHIGNHQSDGMVLHYSQELARCEVEISNLRKKNYELESAMRELQMSFVVKEEKYSDEIDRYRDEIRRLKRMTTEEGANFEYLKNVVLTYMLSSDVHSREHMLKAIGAVLMFSENEVQRVRIYNASWWGSGTAASSTQTGSKKIVK